MSRIGKKPIEVPAGVEISLQNQLVSAKGPLGELSVEYSDVLSVEQEGSQLIVKEVSKQAQSSALWGLYRSLIANIVEGVSSGFTKRLVIEGVGYKAEVASDELILNLGYSHLIIIKIPQDIKIQVEKSIITISGPDKQQVGSIAATIRAKRPPEPYKGKGIHYEGEHIRRKQGKRAATTAG